MKHSRPLVILLLLYASCCYGRTSAIIENWNLHLTVPAPNELTQTEFLRLTILNEDGYKHAIYFDYYNSFRKIRSLHYTIYDGSNKRVKKLSKIDALDVMINPNYEVADTRTLMLDPKYRQFPFTVEIEVTVSYSGFLNFPVWMPRHSPDLEVKQASLTLEAYEAFEYAAREINGVAKPQVVIDRGMRKITWSIKDLAPAGRHMTTKSFLNDQPQVHVTPIEFSLDNRKGSFRSWADFGDWFWKLNDGRTALSQETKDFLDKIYLKHAGISKDIVKSVYRHMQSRTRYISIQLGIGGFQAIPADEVDRSGYGDCKALSNYMKAMLDYLHIPSNFVLAHAGSDVADILGDFPSNQFNHLFLAVPLNTDTLWLECTSQIMPASFIGTFTDDRFVLWVRADGNSKILRTPAYTEAETVRTTHGIAEIGSQGNVRLDLLIKQTGIFFDESHQYSLQTKDDIKTYNQDKFVFKDFVIRDFKHEIPDPDRAELFINYNIDVIRLGKSVDNQLILPYNFLNPIEHELKLDYQSQKSEVRRAFTLDETIDMKLPPDMHPVDNLAVDIKENSEFGTLMLNIQLTPLHTVRIHRRIVIHKGNYRGESFDNFYRFVKLVRSYEQRSLVLKSKT